MGLFIGYLLLVFDLFPAGGTIDGLIPLIASSLAKIYAYFSFNWLARAMYLASAVCLSVPFER